MCAWRKARRTRKRFLLLPPTPPQRRSTNGWRGRYYSVSNRRTGLPIALKMRHNAHYVEEIISRSGAAIGRMIAIEQIQPNSDHPRKEMGDLRGLTESVREKGVLEPLLVRYLAEAEKYLIISGE